MPTHKNEVGASSSLPGVDRKDVTKSGWETGTAETLPSRYTIQLGPRFSKIVQETAEARGVSAVEVFRRALAMMDAIDSELQNGHDIHAVSSEGFATKLVFL
ncbi:hypothetical protein [Agromyces seonyuensis]|uniref:Uncharacterized protein n=1 Tax=Agromyces seonyuensis TaxID=2662446 RepID=A0A6I4P1S5_9MICO|nr:hypothetical protein [Agromyces seonyuensis]MWB97187.1 hypothetical protein [Agromyces seonyuensis]